jgi:hypothetical protein
MKIGSSGKRVRLWGLVWSSAIANQQSEHVRVFRSGARGAVKNRMYSSIPQETHFPAYFRSNGEESLSAFQTAWRRERNSEDKRVLKTGKLLKFMTAQNYRNAGYGVLWYMRSTRDFRFLFIFRFLFF